MNKTKPFLIIDFDSTFVTLECLEELGNLALKGNPNRREIMLEVRRITNLGMEGKIPFSESLARRFRLFKANKKHVQDLVERLKNEITPSVKRNAIFFKLHKDRIYIISGGFKEWIIPIVKEFEINTKNVLANDLIFDEQNNIIGFDKDNPLAHENGKVEKVRQLSLEGDVYVVGDGYTDYEIKEAGLANKFFAFTENVEREPVIRKADDVLTSFDELFQKILKIR